MLVRFLVLELLFQALSRYSKILVYTCISEIFCSRTVILQLLVVQVVWFLLQFLCLRCIARSAYVFNVVCCQVSTNNVHSYQLSCGLDYIALCHVIAYVCFFICSSLFI